MRKILRFLFSFVHFSERIFHVLLVFGVVPSIFILDSLFPNNFHLKLKFNPIYIYFAMRYSRITHKMRCCHFSGSIPWISDQIFCSPLNSSKVGGRSQHEMWALTSPNVVRWCHSLINIAPCCQTEVSELENTLKTFSFRFRPNSWPAFRFSFSCHHHVNRWYK